MSTETNIPRDVTLLFKFWYSNQNNNVRWAGSLSEGYRLECGVRQGGLSSPTLFNLYMNRLIDELSSTGIGCHIDGWITEDMKDNLDIEKERRALSVRCNMLARRFAKCTNNVKFKAYCQSFYACGLWVDYTQRIYSDLRIQYNNAFRMLMGLPRYCSASAMFADATDGRTDGFEAIMRKRCASLMQRVRRSPNSILSALMDRWDSAMLARWIHLHVG
ncbi:PREDICTED: uncharacterized protein LOC106105324 [Papilio polytes]|uniref:uncharacterized protein LOC106105324 n=1 Tax=Papilio polytes TaxID=76194 RepID=UPI0006766ECE|nr:PREDICTED: uncharacterized protein LOC106105324 [Papilio polytes]